MPVHSESRFLRHPPDLLYDLVADIEKYPEFLPWCLAVRTLDRTETQLRARMTVGFKLIRESFTSEVTLTPKVRIDVEYLEGPFRYLKNRWVFNPAEGGCKLDFDIDFEFRSRLLRRVMEPVFHDAVKRMIRAFENRARKIDLPG